MKKGQALLELAIFGAFLLLLLGLLVNYGLRYYFQMKVKTEAFRNTLTGAANDTEPGQPSAVSSLFIRDKYIADASAPFGYSTPVSASTSGVTRNPDLRIGPDRDEELPRIQVYLDNATFEPASAMGTVSYLSYPTLSMVDTYRGIYDDVTGYVCTRITSRRGRMVCTRYGWQEIYNNSSGTLNPLLIKCCGSSSRTCLFNGSVPPGCPSSYTLQRIRYTNDVFLESGPMTFTSGKFVYANYTTVDQTEKYREIYGDMLGCGNSRCTSWASLYDSEGGINDALRKCCGTNSSSCQTGGAPPACPSGYTLQRIKYVDYVDSQLMDYGSTVRQCRQLVDVDVCTHECMKGSTGVRFANVTACNNICRQNINIPWYCANYTETNTTLHQYDFANLNKIFEGVAKKTKGTLGLQQDYEKTSYGANFVEVNADSTYLGANDILCFSDKIKRWVVYRPLNATANETIKEERKSKVGTAVTVYEQTPR